MKISDFEMFAQTPTVKIASVRCTTGMWWWRKTWRANVCLRKHGVYWFWADTGEFTPGYQVEDLYKAWRARQ